jgi:glycosyltransferase involved in cell wall biosynthesis
MPVGAVPNEYFLNPSIEKPMEEIYAETNAFSCELLEESQRTYQEIELYVVLPPLHYDGKWIKGIWFSPGADIILKHFPQAGEMFHTIADSQWCSYPKAQRTDALFSQYNNPARDQWFRHTTPDRSQKILIPKGSADYVNERLFTPIPGQERDIDLLCVARLDVARNLPLLAQALKIYRQKYPAKKIMLTLITGQPWDFNPHQFLSEPEMMILREIESILIHPRDYIHFVKGYLYYENEFRQHFARAKAYITASLFGWKGQRMPEAMCCNTPVICLKDYNRFVRGEEPALPEGAGKMAAYHPEALADAIYDVLENQDTFHPRQAYLKQGSRQHFLNTCIDAFPYYEKALPDYTPGKHHQNYWLDAAMQQTYQMSLYEMVTHQDLWKKPFRAQGMQAIDETLRTFHERCRPPVAPSPPPKEYPPARVEAR